MGRIPPTCQQPRASVKILNVSNTNTDKNDTLLFLDCSSLIPMSARDTEKPAVVPEDQEEGQENKCEEKDNSKDRPLPADDEKIYWVNGRGERMNYETPEEQQDSKNEEPRDTENPASSAKAGKVFRWINDDEVESVDEGNEQFFSAETDQGASGIETGEVELKEAVNEMNKVAHEVERLRVEAANAKENTGKELDANAFKNLVSRVEQYVPEVGPYLTKEELEDYAGNIEGWITLSENASKEAKDVIERGILAAAQLNLQHAEKVKEFDRIRVRLRKGVRFIQRKRMKDEKEEDVPSLQSSSDEEDEETVPRFRKMPALNEGSVGPGELSKVRMMPAIISMATILKQEVWKDSMTVPKRTSPPLDWMQTMSALRGMVWKHDIRIEMDGEVKVMRAVLDTGGEATLIRDSRVPTNLWEDAWRVENGVLSGVGSVKFDRMIPLLLAFGTRVESALWVTALPFPSNEWPFDDCDVVIDYMTLQVLIEAVYFSDIHMIRVKPRSREDMFRVIQQLKNDDMSKSASQMFNRDYRLASLGPVE